MIYADEMEAIEERARAVRLTMTDVCRLAGKHRQSWFRARKRGRAEYSLIDPLERALTEAEAARVA